MIRYLLNRKKLRRIIDLKMKRDEVQADIDKARKDKKRVRHLYDLQRRLTCEQVYLERKLW